MSKTSLCKSVDLREGMGAGEKGCESSGYEQCVNEFVDWLAAAIPQGVDVLQRLVARYLKTEKTKTWKPKIKHALMSVFSELNLKGDFPMKNIKKFLALALVIVSVLALAAPALAASNMYVKVSQGPGYTVNVRKTASANAAVVTTLTYGSCVSADAASGGYHKVSFYNPKTKTSYTGYIQEGFLVSSIPSDTKWIAMYGTRDHKLTNSVYAGCAALQDDLNKELGLSLTLDGICGNNTVSAITQFQRNNSLSADGVAGNMTKEYLYKIRH